MDYSTFCQMLEGFLNPEANIRQQAEHAFENIKKQDPTGTLLMASEALKTSPNNQIRLQSVSILHTFFRGDIMEPTHVWQKLSLEQQNAFKLSLLQSLESEPLKLTRNYVCDIISDLASELIPKHQWNDLGDRLFHMASSQDSPVMQQCGFKILGGIFPVISEELARDPRHVESLCSIIRNCLQVADLESRYECIGFIGSIVEDGNKKIYKKLADTLPLIIQSVSAMIESGRKDGNFHIAARTMEQIVSIADCENGDGTIFFRPHLTAICEWLFRIASMEVIENSEEEACKKSAVEALLCIAENNPKLAMKVRFFINNLIEVLMKLMLDIKDEMYKVWLDTGEDDEEDEQRLFNIGEEGLDRAAHAFRNEEDANFMIAIFQFVSQFLQSNEWHYKFVGILSISQTVEYLEDEEQLEQIIPMLLQQLKNNDQRVRFAACQAIAQVALDHQPFVQEHFYAQVLPALIETMDDSHVRVQAHATAAFVNFAEEVEKKDLFPYADIVMQKMLQRININTSRLILENTITATAVVAGVMEEQFIKYYSTVMPLMMQIFQNFTSEKDRVCRGKAIECISVVGLSVGLDHFLNDGKAIMQALLTISNNGFEDDDPVKEYLQEALGRLCSCLKEHFVQYLPHIVPGLLATLTQTPKELKDEELDDDNDDMSYIMLDSGKSIGLKTSLIEDQKQSLELLSTFIEVLKEHYKDFIQSTAAAVLPMLTHILSDDVKEKALNATNSDKNMLQAMITTTAEASFQNLEDDDLHLSIAVAEVAGLNQCLQKAGPNLLNKEVVNAFTKKVFSLLHKSKKRRAEAASRKHEKDIDEDDVEKIEWEEQQEQTIRLSVLDILGAIMKHHPHEFMAGSAQDIIAFIQENLKPDCSNDDLTLAMCISDDILEHLKEVGIPLWNIFMERLLCYITSDDPTLSQVCCNCICFAAKIPAFSCYAETAAGQLMQQIKRPNATKNQRETSSTDNAVAALGDLVRHHGNSLRYAEQYLQTWLNYLPLKSDDIEGIRVHKELIELVLQNNPSILGPNNENIPRIVGIFASIYRTEFSDSETDENIKLLVQQLGVANILKIKDALTSKQQNKIQRLLNDAKTLQAASASNSSN